MNETDMPELTQEERQALEEAPWPDEEYYPEQYETLEDAAAREAGVPRWGEIP